jgi:hypothetical protein
MPGILYVFDAVPTAIWFGAVAVAPAPNAAELAKAAVAPVPMAVALIPLAVLA